MASIMLCVLSAWNGIRCCIQSKQLRNKLTVIFFLFNSYFRHEVFSALISDILCPEMTEQITCFLLPSIADRSARFPFVHLLKALLILLSKPDDSGGSNKGVTPTPWLLYGVLAFVGQHLGMYFSFKLLLFISHKYIIIN